MVPKGKTLILPVLPGALALAQCLTGYGMPLVVTKYQVL